MSSPSSEYVPDEYIKTEDGAEEVETPKHTRKSAKGRKLMRWNPEKDQLILLCVEYIVNRDGVDLNWNEVAKEAEDHLSGDAIKQHLFKLRAARQGEGQKCPPKLDRKAVVAAKKKNNPLVDTSKKTPKTPKRRTKKDSDEDDEEPPKPTPKTTGLLHLKIDKTKKTTPKKRSIKEESDDDMGRCVPKQDKGDDKPTPTPRKKKVKRTNFPEEEYNSPVPAPKPAAEPLPRLPSIPAEWVPQEMPNSPRVSLRAEEPTPELGVWSNQAWDAQGYDPFFEHGGDVAAPAVPAAPVAPMEGMGELTLPSQVGEFSMFDEFGVGLEPFMHESFWP